MLKHVAGHAEVMDGIIGRLLDFLELGGGEAILAGLARGKDGPALGAGK
jgi:hypothetical protein